MVNFDFIEEFGFEDITTLGTKTFIKRNNPEMLEDGLYFESLLVIRVRENFESGTHFTIKSWNIHRIEYEIEVLDNPNKFDKEYLFQGWIETEEEFKNLMKQLRIK